MHACAKFGKPARQMSHVFASNVVSGQSPSTWILLPMAEHGIGRVPVLLHALFTALS